MIRKFCGVISCMVLLLILFVRAGWAQQNSGLANSVSCPSGQPGIYVHGKDGWHLLSQADPAKIKAKHSFLSSMSYGAVAAPMVVEYAGLHAAVQIHDDQPSVCVVRILNVASPILVRLQVKKKFRELDSGNLRAVPFRNDARQAKAEASIIVPSATENQGDGVILLNPKSNLTPGEYAVMFGTGNLAIFDFGVASSQ